MPRICGIVGRGVPGVCELLAKMVALMKHHPWYGESRYCPRDAPWAMARLSLSQIDTGNPPASNEDGTLLAVMAGEIYDYAEQRRSLISRGHKFGGEDQAEVLLHGFEADGSSFFRQLHGMFSAAIWDGRSNRLVLTNDRFGMRPLYYAVLADRLLFASEIKALLADTNLPRKSHLSGIAQFFTFAQLLRQDTLIEGVRALPPATCLNYNLDRGSVTLDPYWSPILAANAHTMSELESLARIDKTFVSSVERRTAGVGHVGISLSGGMDSRTILGVIAHERVSVTAVTFGVHRDLDDLYAQRMTALMRCRYQFCPITSDFVPRFEEHMTAMVHLTDGQLLSQGMIMPSLPLYRDLKVDALVRGHAGEVLHMHDAYNFSINREGLAAKDEPALEQWLFQRLQTYYGLVPHEGRLFAKAYDSDLRAAARDSLRLCLRESESLDGPVRKVSHLFLTQMLPRQCGTALMKPNSFSEVRLPYLDEDFIDAVLAAPPALRIGHRIQTYILKNRAPQLLRVFDSNTHTRPGSGRARLFVGKVRARLLSKLGVPRYRSYSHMRVWLQHELQPVLYRTILSERCLDRGILDPDTVRLVVQGHVTGQRNYTSLIIALLIFEIGQRKFIDTN